MIVEYYNILINNYYFSNRWLDILDVIIEKRAGPTLGKLHTIQLIEVDLQLLIRVFMSYRNQRKIENDNRISKCNYRLRYNYSIESEILEKRLIYNISRLTGNDYVHNLTDLQLY